ncbi:hypothetical protein SRABI106_01635 [Rahnella aquatilis]|nr:hypothetical protein SRABI106_01635 [Rahnella aquatilis]
MKPIHHYRLACLREQERRLQQQLEKVRGHIEMISDTGCFTSRPWIKRFISWWRAA